MDFVEMLDDLDTGMTPLDDFSGKSGNTPRTRTDPFTEYSDEQFKLRYRFRKDTVRMLIQLLEDKLARPTARNNTLKPETLVLMALRFAATGIHQKEDGDLHGISQPAVSRNIHTVFEAIASMHSFFIKFPGPGEFDRIERAFYATKGVPGVLGAVDGTHIRILNPGGEDSELYRNRKGWFSINTQILCDDRLCIRNIVASWKGSTHDARIFNESALKLKVEELPPQYHILGDSGYPCLRGLLIPVPRSDAKTPAERRFNAAHSSTRMAIERLNGILKRRFPCLDKRLNLDPSKCGTIIVACAVLHNLALMQNNLFDDDFIEPADEEDVDGTQDSSGAAKRARIIRDYFEK